MLLTTPEIDTDHLADAVRCGHTIVDVREPWEYVLGHVPGSELIPQDELPHRCVEISRNGPVYVICQTGNRSATMTDYLRRIGYEAFSVAGGTERWVGSGRPLVGGYASRF